MSLFDRWRWSSGGSVLEGTAPRFSASTQEETKPPIVSSKPVIVPDWRVSAPAGISLDAARKRNGANGNGNGSSYDPVSQLQSLSPSLAAILRPQAAYRWLLPYLSAITPQYIEGVLRGAMAGTHVQAWELFDLMPDTDPDIAACIGEYNDGILCKRLIVSPYCDEDEEPSDTAKEKQKLVSYALRNMRPDLANDENDLYGTVRDVAAARFHGQSILEVDWMEGYGSDKLNFANIPGIGRSLVPRSTYWVHPVCYAYDMDGRMGLRASLVDPRGNPNDALVRQATKNGNGSKNGKLKFPQPGSMVEPPAWNWITSQPRPSMLSPFPPDKFLISIVKAKTGTALSGSCLRPLAWWWCASNFCFDYLLNLAQLFGIPFRKASYKPGTSEAMKQEVRTMLQQVGNAGWALLPDTVLLEFESATGSAGQSPQAFFAKLAEDMKRKVILRQTMTGGSTSGGDKGVGKSFGTVEQGVKAQCVQAGADHACRVLNLQLIPSILRRNYGPTGDTEAPIVSLVNDDEGGLEDAQRDQLLTQFVNVPVSWLRQKYRVPKPAANDTIAGLDEGTAGAAVKAAKEQQDQQVQMQQQQAGAQQAQADAMQRQAEQSLQEPEEAESGEDADTGEETEARNALQAAIAKAKAESKPEHVAAVAKALHETVEPVLKRFEAIQEVEDVETRKLLLAKFVRDHEAIATALSHDKSLARELESQGVAKFVAGLKGGA